MKHVLLAAVAALALALSGCDSAAENKVEQQTEAKKDAVEKEGEAKKDAIEAGAPVAPDAATTTAI